MFSPLQVTLLTSISLEMIYRSLDHFSVAQQKGQVTDPVRYFAQQENQDLGIVKRQLISLLGFS
jgi:hypothetical protein